MGGRRHQTGVAGGRWIRRRAVDGDDAHHVNLASTAAMQLVYSARTRDDVIYREELPALADSGHRAVTFTFTREESPASAAAEVESAPTCSTRSAGRQRVGPTVMCATDAVVEAVAAALVELGHEPAQVKTERFGPTGEWMNQARLDGNVTAGDLERFSPSTSRRPSPPAPPATTRTRSPLYTPTCRHPHGAAVCLLRRSPAPPRALPRRAWLDLRGIDMLDIPGP